MFKETITGSSFVGSYSENAMRYVTGGMYNGDVSMLSTLRALLYNRIPRDQHVSIQIRSADGYRIKTPGTMYGNRVDISDNAINIVSITGTNEAFSSLENDAEWAEYGYCKIEKITAFFRKSFHTLCYVNEPHQNVVLMVENLDIRKLHFIQCAVSVFLPWFFPEPEKKLNDLEIKLIQSLAGNNSEDYIKATEDIYQSLNLNLRDEAIRSMLTGIEKTIYDQTIQALRNQIDAANRDIENRFASIRDIIASKEDKEIRLRGYLQAKESKNENEISDYFIATKNVDVEDVSGSRITFVPFGYMSVWDDNEFSSLVNYSYSDLYEYGDRSFSKEDKALIMNAIFAKRTVKIKVCACYTINIGTERSVDGYAGYTYSSKFDGYMKNPHIDEYNCLGNYRYSIEESLSNGNVIMAVEQTIMSSKSLNLSDGAVMRRFYKRLFSENSPKFLELPDGTSATTREAIDWLKKQQEGNE